MSLLSEIKKDQLAARKDKNTAVTSILTTLIGEASMAGKNDGNRESTDLEVVAVIKKFIKNINEMIGLTVEGSDSYIVAYAERLLLETYLPVQLNEDNIKAIIAIQIALNSYTEQKHMGKLMSHLKNNYAGQYDGKLASKVVRDMLNGG